MRLCSLCLWSHLHSLRSPKVRLLLSAIIAGKADEPFCGIVVHRTRPLTFIIDLGVVFPGFPFFSVLLSGLSRSTERISDSALNLLFNALPWCTFILPQSPGAVKRFFKFLRIYFPIFPSVALDSTYIFSYNCLFRTISAPNQFNIPHYHEHSTAKQKGTFRFWNIPSDPVFRRSGRYPAG